MLRLVVDTVEHHVLERDAASVLLLDVPPTGIQQFRDRMFAIDGHQLIAQTIVGGMQRDRQSTVGLLRQTAHLRHQSRGADGNSTPRNIESQVIHEYLRSPYYVAVVGEWLP